MKWASYLENEKVITYVLKLKKDLIGYFEVINDRKHNSSEIAYFGILKIILKKFGGYLLSEAIKICFSIILKEFGFIHVL